MFGFVVEGQRDDVMLEVWVPLEHREVLEALVIRAVEI